MTDLNIEKRLKKLERQLCCIDKEVQFFDTFGDFPLTGSENNLYVDNSTGDIYIWDGAAYITTTDSDRFHTNIVGVADYNSGLPLTGWTAPALSTNGDTVSVLFTDNVIGNYTFMGGVWVLNYIEEQEALNGLRILATGEAVRGSDSSSDAKGSALTAATYNHLNSFSDNWVQGGTSIFSIFPTANSVNRIVTIQNGDLEVNGIRVGKSKGNRANNTVVGGLSLESITTGDYNTAIGFASMYNTTTGGFNTVFGVRALQLNVSGSGNQAFGDFAGYGATGSNNIAIGSSALYQNTGSTNIAIGRGAMYNGTGNNSIAIGLNSMQNSTANNNIGVGNLSMRLNTTGYYNTAIGHNSLENNTTGFLNTAIGYYSMVNNTTGTLNTAVGASTLFDNTTGSENTAIGRESSRNNTTGNSNVSVGYFSNTNNSTGDNNVALGVAAMLNANGSSRQTAVGRNALILSTLGFENTAIGYNTLWNLRAGCDNNTVLGTFAGESIGAIVFAGNIIPGNTYTIQTVGTSDFTLIGSPDNIVGTTFVASGPTPGTGYVYPEYVSNNNTLVGHSAGINLREGEANTVIGANIQVPNAFTNNHVVIGDGDGNVRMITNDLGDTTFTGTGAITVPVGDTAQQPATPVTGMMRFNTDGPRMEYYDGTVWVPF